MYVCLAKVDFSRLLESRVNMKAKSEKKSYADNVLCVAFKKACKDSFCLINLEYSVLCMLCTLKCGFNFYYIFSFRLSLSEARRKKQLAKNLLFHSWSKKGSE